MLQPQATNSQDQAALALEMAKKLLERQETRQPDGKEDIFCKFLCNKLKNLKLQTTYEEVTLEIINYVSKKTEEEREVLQQQQQENATSLLEIEPPYCLPSTSKILGSDHPKPTEDLVQKAIQDMLEDSSNDE